MTGPRDLILLRHGESVFTARSILNGDANVDGPLTELGRKQAGAAAAELSDDPIDLCISSAFPRTRETAAIVIAGRAIPHEVMPELNDPPVGAYEGQGFDEYFRWVQARGWTDTYPGCESQLESLNRYIGAFASILERDAGCVLVVAHAFVTSFALTLASGDGPMMKLHYEKPVDLATPYRVAAGDLWVGLERARQELAELQSP